MNPTNDRKAAANTKQSIRPRCKTLFLKSRKATASAASTGRNAAHSPNSLKNMRQTAHG